MKKLSLAAFIAAILLLSAGTQVGLAQEETTSSTAVEVAAPTEDSEPGGGDAKDTQPTATTAEGATAEAQFTPEQLKAMQQGLPPALHMEVPPTLAEQITTLEQMAGWVEENAETPGLLDGLKFWQEKEQVVTAEQLRLGVQPSGKAYEGGELVAVEGVFQVGDAGKPYFPTPDPTKPLVLEDTDTAPVEGLALGQQTELEGLPLRARGRVVLGANGVPKLKVNELQPAWILTSIRLGRAYELMGQYEAAIKAYEKGLQRATPAAFEYGAFAGTQAGLLAYDHAKTDSGDPDLGRTRGLFHQTWTTFTKWEGGKAKYHTWKHTGDGVWVRMEVDKAVEAEYREASDGQLWYQLVDFFVGTLARGNAGIGLVILALLIKVMLHPMTKKQIASQRDMARLQPEMKRLQEKYKDDKQKINEEFWKLCQEHGVNPLGGCMPMIPQLIVMILVYQGIRAYVMNLSQPFLWIDSLAHPDIYLLLVYTASQFGFGKLTQTQNPAASDPQQQQTQKMMTWIMPIFLFFVFQSFPSAFILFFFVFNAVHIAQHLYINRAAELAEQAPAGAVSGGGNSGVDDEEGRPQSYAEKKSRGRGKLSNREKAKERRKRRR